MFKYLVLILFLSSVKCNLVPIDFSHIPSFDHVDPDPAVGDLLANKDPSDRRNPEELGNLFQSDMKMPHPRLGSGLAGDVYASYRWPNATVVYDIVADFTPSELSFLKLAMQHFENNTCIRFKKRTKETAYVQIQNENSGCWSDVGRGDGMTQINLQNGCANAVGTPIHEIMHTLGFFHEHTRVDRDSYVYVNYSNVLPDPGAYYQFEKDDPDTTTNFSVPYNLGSIMHYTGYFFSKDPAKLPTLIAIVPWNGPIGQRDGFTPNDILLINIMYCGASKPWPSLKVPWDLVTKGPKPLFEFFLNYFMSIFKQQ